MLQKLPHIAYIMDEFYVAIFPPVTFKFQPRVGVTLLIALNGKSFTLTSETGDKKHYSAAILNRQHPIIYHSDSVSCLEINFFPLTYEYHSLAPFLNDQSLLEITFNTDVCKSSWISDLISEKVDANQLIIGCNELLNCIEGYSPATVAPDNRAMFVAKTIRKDLPKINLLESHASKVGLSGDRLSHLFKAEFHMPIKSFILIEKMKLGGFFLTQGMSITEASQEAGFADSAHFTRSFKDFFGITPRRMFDSITVHFLLTVKENICS